MGNLLVLGINFMLETKFTHDGTRHMVNNSKSRRKMGKRRMWLLNIKRDNYHGQRICLSKNERNGSISFWREVVDHLLLVLFLVGSHLSPWVLLT